MSKIICWWSGGVTSAVACWIAIEWFGKENCEIVFIDTYNESDDTMRFKKECEIWYGLPIKSISNQDYTSIQEVWEENKSLNTATGAICSTELKRKVRESYQKTTSYRYQVFGFDTAPNEVQRAIAMRLNYPETNPIFPLLGRGLSKKACIKIIEQENNLFHAIRIPESYYNGYSNNNCEKTGCVQGGIGYWQKRKIDHPAQFDAMAVLEHKLTDKKGEPVTCLKDQSKGGKLVFLKPHPDYPDYKDISMMKGRPAEALMDCNGFCGLNDLSG